MRLCSPEVTDDTMTDHQAKIERLLAYAAGELPQAEVADMQKMIATDAELRRLQRLVEFVGRTLREDDSVAPPADVVARAKALFQQMRPAPAGAVRSRVQEWLEALDRVVAALTFDSRARAALAGFRGTAELVRLSFESDLAEIDLELNPREEGGEMRMSIIGQISSTDEAGGSPVVLTETGTHRAVAQTVCDQGGLFEVTIERGRYDLHVRLPSGVVSAMEIEL
jgi:hypothetical protein